MVSCSVCFEKGLIPKCPFCGRAGSFKHKKRKSNMEKILTAKEKEREKLNQKAYDNFRKANAVGSGCESFDEDVKATHGDWHGS
jgi:hypothetical protein